MITEWIKKEFEKKWEKFDEIPYYLKDVQFNYFFRTKPFEKYDEVSDACGFRFPKDLMDIYSQTNGMRLFLSSFCIYGIQDGKEEVEPYDLQIENHNIHARLQENGCDNQNLFFFGSFGRRYVFAFEVGKKKYFLMENGKNSVLREYDGVNDIISYFIPKMIENYNKQYINFRPNLKYRGIPALENAIYSLEDVGIHAD